MAPVSPAFSSPRSTGPSSEHPLLIAALLVWLSVELIGDGLMALVSLTGSRTATPSSGKEVTPS